MSKQALLDYLDEELIEYDAIIAEKQTMKTNLDTVIAEEEALIAYYEAEKVQQDVDIAECEQDKIYVNELIVIVEAT